MKANEFLRDNGIVKCSRIVEDLSEQGVDSDFTKDLKRIVESHELVESFGGLKMAKESLKNLPSEYQSYTMTRDDTGATTQSFKLYQAIADVESCQ